MLIEYEEFENQVEGDTIKQLKAALYVAQLILTARSDENYKYLSEDQISSMLRHAFDNGVKEGKRQIINNLGRGQRDRKNKSTLDNRETK